MSIRLKRLQADYEKIVATFQAGGRILIKAVHGNPPEKYQIEFLVNSLVMKPDGSVAVKNSHLAEIYLTRSYPRQPPQCRMLTPVFHPNIAPHAICIGDHWAAGESLSHLIVRIGEMLSFQSYNLKSPLNGEAAKWVDKNRSRLPIDKMDFSSYYEAGEKTLSEQQASSIGEGSMMACANCGTQVQGSEILVCSSKHPVCQSCALSCAACGRQLCLKCLTSKCSVCGQIICAHCHFKCRSCQTDLCSIHTIKCHICNAPVCPDCSVDCAVCGKPACLDHIKQVPGTGEYRCHTCGA
ncbi:MAG TPA: ubiquitin-conjugating enzyme E2 [Candidatus Ozemobacteraceae bacterium]|nr:ubiquitin-conjugating enzyme E2 [Candidatus Ozemobacteraceae bacterium]